MVLYLKYKYQTSEILLRGQVVTSIVQAFLRILYLGVGIYGNKV